MSSFSFARLFRELDALVLRAQSEAQSRNEDERASITRRVGIRPANPAELMRQTLVEGSQLRYIGILLVLVFCRVVRVSCESHGHERALFPGMYALNPKSI